MACLLCFSTTTPDECINIYDYGDSNMITGAELIQKHFPFYEQVLTEEVLNSNQTVLCKSCWINLENFHELFICVASNYNANIEDINLYAKEVNDAKNDSNTEDFIIYDAEVKENEMELIKVEVMNSDVAEYMGTEWIEEVTEEITPRPLQLHKKLKTKHLSQVSSDSPKMSRQTATPIFDSADDQRIRDTAKMNCEICGDSVDNLRDAKSHYKQFHGVEGYLMCCERRFKQRCRLVEHVNTHYNFGYNCHICSKTFDSKSYLSKHLACHDETKPFSCAHCPKSFSRKFQVRNHLMSVHIFDNIEPSFECPKENCHKKFVNPARLKHHIDYTHSMNHIEICEICSKTFRTKNAIDEHMKTHARKAEDRIRCEICGHYLADLKSYNRHVKNHGTEQLDNTCSHCGKKSPNLNALRKHIKYVHEMEKNHQCRFCEKSFKRPRDLIDHEAALHTLQDLYACSFCSKTFRNQSNMLAHRKKMHPDQYKKPAYMRDDVLS